MKKNLKTPQYIFLKGLLTEQKKKQRKLIKKALELSELENVDEVAMQHLVDQIDQMSADIDETVRDIDHLERGYALPREVAKVTPVDYASVAAKMRKLGSPEMIDLRMMANELKRDRQNVYPPPPPPAKPKAEPGQ